MMIVSDLLRFCAVCGLALVDAGGHLSFAWLVAFAILVGLGDGFFYPDRHLKIDNTALEPDAVARQIAAHFSLPLSRP